MSAKTISKYTIIEKIGQGGMGEVYLAEDKLLQRKVAIKILAPHSTDDDEARSRFQGEARAAAALSHPNIITIYEMGMQGDQYFIAMEYIDGRSLRDLIKNKELDIKTSLNLTIQICEGVSKAHKSGIIHRDLKPENLIIDKDGRLKILDFGIAKLKGVSTNTTRHSFIGTLLYMSPEQIQGKEVDARSDIFSIGCVLYEMLTGTPGFYGDYPQSVMYAVIHEEPKPLSEINPSIPPTLQEVINKALNKKPGLRYQNLLFMKNDLEDIYEKINQAPPKTIEHLLEERQKIDRIIENEYTRNVTIMFCDVVGSTAFFEQRGNLEGRAMIQRYVNLMSPVIIDHEGQIIKTIGDGILASFHDPHKSARAAIAMQTVLQKDNAARREEDRIAIRIAMHFGRAVVDKADVFGDVVNVASRLEHFTQPNDIMVSEVFYEQLKENSDLQFQFAGKAQFKGKSAEMPYYRLMWNERQTVINRVISENAGPIETRPNEKVSVRSEESGAGTIFVRPYKMIIPEATSHSSLSDKLKNPYMNRVKIQNIEEFYGRKSEIMKIYSRIGASRPQSISIVGERRIGKSSLLNYIYHPANRKQFLQNPDEFIFVFIDFQEKREIDITDFFQTVYKSLKDDFGESLRLNEKADYAGFKEMVNAFDKEGYKLILLFDEFEVITKNKRFGTEFYSYARSLANNYNVAYVVSSGRNLQTLCHSKEIGDSPFFNIFSNLTLTTFSPTEAHDLIVQPAAKLNVVMNPYIDFITDIAGYYPFFIQMACASLFEYLKNSEKTGPTLMTKVKEEFWDEAKVHFQQIWDVCDEDKREILLLLAAENKIPPSKEYLVKELQKEGYVKIKDNQPAILSSLLADYFIDAYGAQRGIKKKKRFIFW